MRPRAFDYAAPRSIEEAFEALKDGLDAKPLAGGQSLMPLMNFRLARPERIVDLRHLSELRYVAMEEQRVVLGAMTTHREIELSEELFAALPMLRTAAREIGHAAIRNRGTIGGSLAHADAAAEWPVVVTALDANVILSSSRGERTVPARDFFRGHFTTALEDDELVTAVQIPKLNSGGAWSFKEFARQAGAFALAIVAVVTELDHRGRIGKLAIVVGGVDSRPVLADTVPFIGEAPSPALIVETAQKVTEMLRPPSNLHASGQDRSDIAYALLTRGLTEALVGAGAAELDLEGPA